MNIAITSFNQFKEIYYKDEGRKDILSLDELRVVFDKLLLLEKEQETEIELDGNLDFITDTTAGFAQRRYLK